MSICKFIGAFVPEMEQFKYRKILRKITYALMHIASADKNFCFARQGIVWLNIVSFKSSHKHMRTFANNDLVNMTCASLLIHRN